MRKLMVVLVLAMAACGGDLPTAPAATETAAQLDALRQRFGVVTVLNITLGDRVGVVLPDGRQGYGETLAEAVASLYRLVGM